VESHSGDAKEALAAIAEGRRLAADLVVTPRWYHPVLGLLIGGLVAVQSVRPIWAVVVGDVLALFGLGVLIGTYRRVAGVWPAQRWHGPTMRARVVLVASFLAVYGLGAALEYGAGLSWALAAAGIVIFGLIVVLGRGFDEQLRADIRGEE
jgi:hypothetical protein